MNARATGAEGERRSSETESFSRIMRALSRSVSPDAVVEAIVHELGAATEADHVAVVRLRPGGSVLDVTFVSMLPAPNFEHGHAAPTAGAVETHHMRELPLPQANGNSLRPVDGEPQSLWGRRGRPREPGGTSSEATDPLRRNVRARSRTLGPIEDAARAREVADRIASQLRDAYGLRNTLARRFSRAGGSRAIVLSRRTSDVWAKRR